jgi:hypothetical protein
MRVVAFLGIWGALWLASTAAALPRTAEEIVKEVRRATLPFQDIARAREAGFVQVTGMEAGHGYHLVNVAWQLLATASVSGTVDLARPPILLYVVDNDLWKLAGVEDALPSKPAVNPFPGATWHEHEASCHYRDNREIPSRKASACPPSHPTSGEPFTVWHPTFALTHVWAWIPSPDGPFAARNRALAPYGGGPVTVGDGHGHPRSAEELAYSQVTHRVAGGVLLAIAIVIAWESWRPRRFPWSSLSSLIWIAFGT